MKKLFLLFAVVGMIFTACESSDRLDDNGDGNPTEQPGGGDDDEIPTDKTQAIKFQDEQTKLICILHWDENEDGELSYDEAASVTDLGTAFKGSSILAFTELKFFTGLSSIANNAFHGCISLLKITLPEQITIIGDWAFNGCSNLKKIAIPNAVTSIEKSAFSGCSSLTSVTIPNGVTSIEKCAFDGCSSLTSVTIPNSVTSIGNFAFSDCTSLTSVTIPDSVTSIGEKAFHSCRSLTEVYCKPTTPPAIHYSYDSWNNSSYGSFPFNSGMTIYVPRRAYLSYIQYSSYSNGQVTQNNWYGYEYYIQRYDFE